MPRTIFRDVGGGRRRANARRMLAASCVLLMLAALPACNTTTPTSPNNNANLTGQTTNQTFTFNGTITVLSSASTLPADDLSTITFVVEVRDAAGNPIPNLTNVVFSTNLGAFVNPADGLLLSSLQTTTFNGEASAVFQSFGRQTGTATITASIGNVFGSSTVELTPAPISGTLSLAFGTAGVGPTTNTGAASEPLPFDSDISVLALDTEGAPIVGANVSFRITEDTTTDNTNNPSAEFTVSRHTTTGSDGIAVNVLRAFGPGTVVVEAELFEPNTGELAATSNRIILTTTQGQGGATALLAFGTDGSGSTTLVGSATPSLPFDTQVGVTATSATGAAIVGGAVRFTIVSDTTNTTGTPAATFVGSSSASTDANGDASVLLRASGPGDVVVEATVTDPSSGQVLRTNQIVLTISPSFLVTMTFSDGTSTSFSAAAPYTEGIIVTVTDTSGAPQSGLTVRLSVTSDTTTAGASVGSGGTTNASGVVNSSVTVPDAGGATSSVQILAEVVDSSGNVLATSNIIVATGT